jgi:hypothetical protein
MDAQHNFSRRLAHVEHLANICGSCFRFILQIIDKPLFSGAGARGLAPRSSCSDSRRYTKILQFCLCTIDQGIRNNVVKIAHICLS